MLPRALSVVFLSGGGVWVKSYFQSVLKHFNNFRVITFGAIGATAGAPAEHRAPWPAGQQHLLHWAQVGNGIQPYPDLPTRKLWG